MARTIIYNADGSVASVTDSTANQGASGPIAASTLSNNGDSNLTGNLTVAGTTALNGSTSMMNANISGTLAIAGQTTLNALVLKQPITFPDGTTQSSAVAAGSGSGGTNSNGATGVINASSISNSGDTNLTGALVVAGTTALNGATNVKAITAAGKAIFQDTSAFTGQATFQNLQATNIVATNNATLQKVTFGDGTTQTTATLKGDQGIQGIQGVQGVKGDPGATGPAASGDITATSIVDSGTLKVTGASTLAALTATTTSLGNTTVANVTLASGGKVTYADGTTQTTATVASSGGTAGPAFRYTTGGPPSSTNPAVQNDGDTAFDPTNLAFYGPRANGAFPTQPFNIVGPTGPQGPAGPKGDAGSLQSRHFSFAGSVWAISATANTAYYFQDTVVSQAGGATVGLTPFVLPMLRSGSVTGFTFNQVGPVSGTYSVTLYKNTVAVTTFSVTGTGIKAIFQTFAAGTYTFVAGDVLTLSVATTGSGNIQGMANLELQTA